MFGFIHESLRQLVTRTYGENTWTKVLELADMKAGKESIVNHPYSDQETFRLLDSVATVLKITVPEIWETYGAFLITFTMETGWDQLLQALSSNLKGFLDNLDSLHYFIDNVIYKGGIRGPSFRCETNPDGTLTLHYYSERSGLYPIVIGVVKEVGRRVFQKKVEVTMLGRTQRMVQMIDAKDGQQAEKLEEHVTFRVQQLEKKTDELESMAQEMEREKAKAEALLREVLPAQVAQQLMEGKSVDACAYSESTVMFSDIPNFDCIVPACHPKDVVTLLNDLFTRFDRLITMQGVYKVETIGDSYMVVAGVPTPIKNHGELICNVALGMLWEARAVMDPVNSSELQVRIGIHSGPVVGGVVGKKMPRFCLFGDTVNTASRMESHGMPGKIHCSGQVPECANKTGRFLFQERGMVDIKGKGSMKTFFLCGSSKISLWEIIGRNRSDSNTIDGYVELNQWKDEGKFGPIRRGSSVPHNMALVPSMQNPKTRQERPRPPLQRSDTVVCTLL